MNFIMATGFETLDNETITEFDQMIPLVDHAPNNIFVINENLDAALIEQIINNPADYYFNNGILYKKGVPDVVIQLTKPDPPQYVQAVGVKFGLVVTFAPSPSKGVEKYEIHISGDPEFTPNASNLESASDSIRHEIGGLASGATYYATVRAIDFAGQASTYTSIVSAETLRVLTADIAAKAVSENKVVGNNDVVTTNAVVWTDIPDMTLTYDAQDTGALIIMSGCGTGGGSFVLSRHGELRMLVDGVEVAKEGPSAILLGAFMQIITVTEPKEYEIKLQWRADREEPTENWYLSTKNRGIFLIHIKR